jgi:hypothetical protein
MRIHSIFWALFIMVTIFFLGMYFYIWIAAHHYVLNLFSIEIASTSGVKKILSEWQSVKVESQNLLYYARLATWVDFLWIISYVAVLIMVSYAIMQKQKSPFLNNLLRFCFLLAVLAGVFDVLENIVLIYDIYRYTPFKKVYSSAIFSWPKWILIFFILLCWLLTLFNSAFTSRKSYYY